MTDARATQGPVLAVLSADADAAVTQAPVLAVHKVIPDARITQAPVLGVYSVFPALQVVQAPVLVVYKGVPCATRWRQIWKIVRTDGVEYRFTSQDVDLDWGGETWKACNSLTPSASESANEVGSVGNIELAGVIATTGIAADDLYAGRFDGAYVEAWLIDAAGLETPKALLRGTFGKVEHGPDGFTVEALGDGGRLQQSPLIDTVKPSCRWAFGSVQCGKDLGPLTVVGAVDSSTGSRAFVDAARAEVPGYFRFGRVTFTSGDNAGITVEIKSHEAGGAFTLWPRLASPIGAGDAYSMTPGCTLNKAADSGTNGCTAWGMILNFGGFDRVPGGDAIAETPDAAS